LDACGTAEFVPTSLICDAVSLAVSIFLQRQDIEPVPVDLATAQTGRGKKRALKDRTQNSFTAESKDFAQTLFVFN
jgi:hypothetical protein